MPYHVPAPDGRRFLPPGPAWDRSGGSDLLIRLKREGPTERDVEFLTAYYDAGVRYVDEHGLGPLLAALDELGLADDTLLVLTADHGEEIFEHGSVLHGYPYDETARVPLVFRGPGIPTGRRVPQLAALVDLMPTILSLLSLPIPEHVQGRDLGPLLRGAGPVNDAVYVDGGGAAYPSSVIADLDGRRWSYFAPVESRRLGRPPRLPGRCRRALCDSTRIRRSSGTSPRGSPMWRGAWRSGCSPGSTPTRHWRVASARVPGSMRFRQGIGVDSRRSAT